MVQTDLIFIDYELGCLNSRSNSKIGVYIWKTYIQYYAVTLSNYVICDVCIVCVIQLYRVNKSCSVNLCSPSVGCVNCPIPICCEVELSICVFCSLYHVLNAIIY